ncbi:MAG: class I SAM-dependent RNA methyltransferase [Treponema sp.]|jgi:23S rRNA (uracil1939-C5)-methyltransferase|nr:class I SAM-dependent RNA methyltransferase [Treponema sp.]
MAAGDVHKLRLESIVALGQALSRLEGEPVFVEGGAPEETAICRIVEEHKTWARAELLEIVEPSPVRIDAACAYYGKCGGCNLQHIDYNAQLTIKTTILKDAFSRIGGLIPPQIEVFPSAPLEYRNRMQFHCLRQPALGGCPVLALKGRSVETIAVTDCLVADSGIREILRKGGKGLPIPPEKDRFTVFSSGGTLLSEGGVQRGKIKLLGKDVIIDVGVFFQSNIVMLEKLILELRKTASQACGTGITVHDTGAAAADLYCGVGTFALFLRDMFPRIVLAEEDKVAAGIARENLKGSDCEFFVLRDSQWEGKFLRRGTNIGFAVADPPRAGLAQRTAAALSHGGPPLLAYVSCDAATLARDSKILSGGGYRLKELKLFDFYPQTAHIESLAVFER